jgi:alpha-L-fucosidase 2
MLQHKHNNTAGDAMQYSKDFKAGRRRVLAGLGTLLAAPSASWAKTFATAAPGPASLWYRQPAGTWNEALPIGNGRLGAMVFGGVAQERLQLNEDTLWSGAPYTPDSPDALAALPRVRALIAEGKYAEASKLASARMMARPLTQMAYGTLGDLLLTFDAVPPGAPDAYIRRLDLDTAIAGTSFRTASGTVEREAFVSAPDGVVVLHLKAGIGRIGFDLAYRPPHGVRSDAPNASGAATVLTPPGAVDWGKVETNAAPGTVAEATFATDGDGTVLITGRNEAGPQTKAGLRYAMRIRVIADGRVDIAGGVLKVRGARTVTLLVAAATSYVDYQNTTGDAVAAVRERIDRLRGTSYAALRERHVRDYRRLAGTMTLELGAAAAAKAAAARPTDVRIAALGAPDAPDDPALAALYFRYARYLLTASSRPGSQPANLQGIWNEGTNAPWGGKYTININTEMNYWPADPAGLGACVEPLLRMTEELAVTGARTARTMYGARGWVAHHNTDLWRAAAPIDGPEWGLWPCGGAWLCVALWDHYDYSPDDAVLRRLYPLLRGASEFFLDTLIEDPQGRGLVTSPSLSPENQHPFGSALCAGPAMDRQIVRDLFARTTEAGRLLGADAALLGQLAQARARIAPDRVGAGGQLQEWLDDWDAQAPEQQHRHVSHLYAVYPSGQVNARDTPALFAAAKVSLDKRGDLATGWGTAWRLCLWARMGDGERAHNVLKGLIGPLRTYPNMFDAHPPFQIDGNFGGAAGIMEMLVQSWGGEVLLLPALPAAWASGQVRGLRARGGLSVDMGWRDGALATLALHGKPGATVRLRYRGKVGEVTLGIGGHYLLGGATKEPPLAA